MSSTSVHGHTVLNYILSQESVELKDLRTWANQTLGSEACFHTCAVQGMSFDALMQFLIERGKISLSGTRVYAHREHICSHDDDHSHSPHDV